MPPADTLVLAWGNPARMDDGLGPAVASALGEMALPGTDVETDYQLQIERAHEVAGYRRVVFVDADRGGVEPFSARRLTPDEGAMSFTTHSVSPATVLALSRDLFEANPEAWLIGIKGYDFDDFGERLSSRARVNLDAAVEYLRSACESGHFTEVASGSLGRDPQDSKGESCKTENT